MAGRGVNDALDAKVYETLVREFGEARAREILGGEPARRRAQVPDVVGHKAKRAPALVPNPNGPKGVSWKDRDTRLEPAKVRLTRYRRQAIVCPCGTRIPPGDEHMLVTFGPGQQRRYCPPCGAAAARAGKP